MTNPAANAHRFLRDLERACPTKISHILTDNGKEFTNSQFGLRKRAATGALEFATSAPIWVLSTA